MRTHCITIDLANQGRRQVRARFDGGRMSSDGGALLLQAVDQRIGLTRRLAASSTLNRLELGTPEQAPQDRYKRIVTDPQRLDALLVELFLDSHAAAPEEIVLDVDATDDPLHGRQEGRFFHGYYDCYCYLPLYVTCGPHLLYGRLRRSNRDAADGGWPAGGRRGGTAISAIGRWRAGAASGGWWARRSGCRAGCAGTTSAWW